MKAFEFKFENLITIINFHKNCFDINVKCDDLLIVEGKNIYCSKNDDRKIKALAMSLMQKLYFIYETNRKLYGEGFNIIKSVRSEWKKLFVHTNFFIDISSKYDIYVQMSYIFSFMNDCTLDIFLNNVQEDYLITLHYNQSPIKTISLPLDRIREKNDFKIEVMNFLKQRMGN